MNLFQLECFLAVASHLNFARAAEQLHVTQPTVSHQIRSLEKELGVSLFTRSTRSVALTGEGRIFLLDAKGIVAQSHTAIQRFAQRDQAAIVPLALGCDSMLGLALPPQVLGRLRQRFPGLHPHLVTLPDIQLFPRLGEGALDGVIALRQTGRAGLRYQEIGKAGFLCLLRKDHPLAGKAALTQEDLAREPLLLTEPDILGSEMGAYQLRLGQGRKPSQLHFCPSHETAAHLTAAGFGVSFLPDTYRLPLGQDLVSLPLLGFPPLPYGLFYKAPVEKDALRALLQEARNG